MVFGRELTKWHEEFFRGSISECLEHFKEQNPRGEFVLIIEEGSESPPEEEKIDPLEQVKQLIETGMDKKTALVKVAKENKISKRELYNRLIAEEGV